MGKYGIICDMKNDGKVGEIPSDAPHWLDWRFDLKPEIAQKLAAACTAKLSDAQVSAAVKKLRKTVQPFLDEVQRWYRDDEVLAYKKRGVKKLFDEHAARLIEDLDTSVAMLESPEVADVVVPDAEDFAALEKLVSNCTILCYPSWHLSDLLTDREFFFYMAEALKAAKGEINFEKRMVLQPVLEDVFCLREITDEYRLQVRLFERLEALCLAAARLLKRQQAHDAALAWIEARQVLGLRSEKYTECLSPQQAAELVTKLKAAFDRLMPELVYAKL